MFADFFDKNRTTVAALVNSIMVAAMMFGLPLTSIQMGALMGVVNSLLVLLAHKATPPDTKSP